MTVACNRIDLNNVGALRDLDEIRARTVTNRTRADLRNPLAGTKAIFRLSGDQQGTLIVPYPPKSLPSTPIFLLRRDMMRSDTSLFSGCPVTSIS